MGGTTGVNEQLDALFHVLRAPRRRAVIDFFMIRAEEFATVRELARVIAAWESDVPESHATGEPYRNVYNALSQTHLPALSEAGVIIYDPQRQTVIRGPTLPLASLLLAINRPTVATLLHQSDHTQ